MSSNVADTSTSNEELNSTVNECNELVSCSVSKLSNKDERVFYYFSDISPLPTAKLTPLTGHPHNLFLVTNGVRQGSILSP